MKLRQNARELVLLNVEGLGLILGEVRYNRQTETVIFALEKASFFDIFFPCTVVYDQQKGPVVHPHILSAMTTSSVRIQRSKVSCFVLESDLNGSLIEQYHKLMDMVAMRNGRPLERDEGVQQRPKTPGRVVPLIPKKDKEEKKDGEE